MISQMSISETKRRFSTLDNNLKFDDTISVTKKGNPTLAVIRWDTYESMEETLEILADKQLVADLNCGIEDMKANKLVDFDDFMKNCICTQ